MIKEREREEKKERERQSLAKEKGGRWLESVRREGTLRLLLS